MGCAPEALLILQGLLGDVLEELQGALILLRDLSRHTHSGPAAAQQIGGFVVVVPRTQAFGVFGVRTGPPVGWGGMHAGYLCAR